ncbi:MAG: hypothetical protein SOZ21_09265 [Candidatus Cryptobacteroides sp.]|nr:hypothetical protein [Candidatus Cryptobacteroides sp.]
MTKLSLNSFVKYGLGSIVGIFACIMSILCIADLVCPNGVLFGRSLSLIEQLYFTILVDFFLIVSIGYLIHALYYAFVQKFSLGEYIYKYGGFYAVLILLLILATLAFKECDIEKYYVSILVSLFTSFAVSIFKEEYKNGKDKCERKIIKPEESDKEITKNGTESVGDNTNASETIEINSSSCNIQVEKDKHRITITIR